MEGFSSTAAVHEFVIIDCRLRTAASAAASRNSRRKNLQKSTARKKAGPEEPGLRYWPREADTITFQEGLLSTRATGGGGQMRNANAQRERTMIPVTALRQPVRSHVRHATTG